MKPVAQALNKTLLVSPLLVTLSATLLDLLLESPLLVTLLATLLDL